MSHSAAHHAKFQVDSWFLKQMAAVIVYKHGSSRQPKHLQNISIKENDYMLFDGIPFMGLLPDT